MDIKATTEAKERFVRITEICGDRRKGIEPLVSVSKSYWWKGVRTGQFPAPIKLSPRVSVWRYSEIQDFIRK
jgi:prophage regulatory protein